MSKMNKRLNDALDELVRYERRGWNYRFRQASMRKLAEMGLVASLDTRRVSAWASTESGRAALSPKE
ncbi:hypothetical protein LB542_19815 [Mesorhizobium sp. BR1-1-9]|uniref:hypothetical protein n=1 Tax=Mesorhizobium sp. BR1-1-9 TaxID=2876646 RepID=UPI001CD15AA2|nr:hypothetical protein [Mesorhizobium sp. BR1-1-9]MBZ9873098.1 hypothetical protein [Mesorhizobium sp. BR1-1-9]